jgi:hypothetical protein
MGRVLLSCSSDRRQEDQEDDHRSPHGDGPSVPYVQPRSCRPMRCIRRLEEYQNVTGHDKGRKLTGWNTDKVAIAIQDK